MMMHDDDDDSESAACSVLPIDSFHQNLTSAAVDTALGYLIIMTPTSS